MRPMQEDMKLRVLVTEGASFIGSHVVDKCLETGCYVAVVDGLSAGKFGLRLQTWLKQPMVPRLLSRGSRSPGYVVRLGGTPLEVFQKLACDREVAN